MRLINTLLPLALHLSPLFAQSTVDENGVSLYEKVEVMEELLLEFQGLETSVNPCGFFQTGDPKRGQQSSAEWVRIVFHDAITADVAAGTGGLDASIGFESDRLENKGIAFINDTIGIFTNFFSVYTSMADIIALGLADSMISCDANPKLIKLKVGRKDAHEAGPLGVPMATDSLSSMFAAFAKAGFSQTEGIQSVACGHSLGAVNFVDHPEIVDPSVVDPVENKDGADSFDTTKDKFDNQNLVEYLSWTGKKGGPLAAGHNQDTNSDFRLFNSDFNATVRAMSPAQIFQDTCYAMFEKMLNTVPASVTLSDVVLPRTWTMQDITLELSNTGVVTLIGQVNSWFKTATPPNTASYLLTTAQGGNTGSKRTGAGVTFNKRGYGRVTNYPISVAINNPSVTGIKVQNSYTAPVDQRLFIIRSQTFRLGVQPEGFGFSVRQLLVRAALLTSLKTPTTTLTATLYFGERQPGTVSQRLTKLTATLTPFKTQGAYTIFQGLIEIAPGAQAGGIPYFDVRLGTTIVSRKQKQAGIEICTNNDNPLAC